MHRCLQLAEMGRGHVAPNPLVGAVLVHTDRIIGEGYHMKYGEAHAEVNCINSVREEDKGLIPESTMYVCLEPCAHFGKTPPCSDLIIKNNIPHVVIGCRDRFAAVNGRGIEKLKAAGVHVTEGVLEAECVDLNKRFFTFHEQHRPYIILKWAQSGDRKIAREGGGRTPISNELSNRLVHRWRSEEQAILVGTNTALLDDPSLTTRLWPGKDPLRLVIDRNLKLPAALRLFDKKVRTIVFNVHKDAEEGLLRFIRLKKDEALIPQLLKTLYNLQVQSLMIEGGSELLRSFIVSGSWDEARVISNTGLVIGNGLDAPLLENEVLIKTERMDTDTISYYRQKEK